MHCITRNRALTCVYSDIIKIIFAIFVPPIGVFLERGCGADLLINILLTILGYIPGTCLLCPNRVPNSLLTAG